MITQEDIDLLNELDGVRRFVRDGNNATGQGDHGWEWDEVNQVLTITNEDQSVSTFTGKEIAENCSDDKRLDRLRSPYAPGCGKATHVAGTNGGTMPCGGELTALGITDRYYCVACTQKGLKSKHD